MGARVRGWGAGLLLGVWLAGLSRCGGEAASPGPATNDASADATVGGDDGAAHAAPDGGSPEAPLTDSEPPVDAAPEAALAIDAGASVLLYHHHPNRDGFYVDPRLTRASAASLHADPSFDGTVPGQVYAQPLYVEDGAGGHGTFYLAQESNDVNALDETTGKTVWHVNLGKAALHSYDGGCGNISPIGITGTPAIDLASRTMVLDAVTGDAAGFIVTHTIHGLSIDDGHELWHVDAATLKDELGRPFSPQPQNQRSAILIVNGVAYVTYGGHAGDCGDYHGWVIGVPLAHPETAAGYATPIKAAGMWAPGGPASDGTDVFVVTGNREDFSTPASTMWQGSEGILRIKPGPFSSTTSTDYFVPGNWTSMLDRLDDDLGGSGPLVIDAPAMTPSALVVAQGKDGNVYVVDRNNLGGIGDANVGTQTVATGHIINAAAFASVGGTTYIALHVLAGETTGCAKGSGDLAVIKLDPAAKSKVTSVWCADNLGKGSPIITTSDGQSDPLVWSAGAEGSSRIHAWDLLTGAPVLENGTAGTDVIAGLRHFTTLVVVHGRIFAGADKRLWAFKPGP